MRLFVKNCLAGFVMRAYLAGIFIIKPKGGGWKKKKRISHGIYNESRPRSLYV